MAETSGKKSSGLGFYLGKRFSVEIQASRKIALISILPGKVSEDRIPRKEAGNRDDRCIERGQRRPIGSAARHGKLPALRRDFHTPI